MAVYTQILYHIIWGTVNQEPVLDQDRQGDLYRFLMGKLQDQGCNVCTIGGFQDHVHILTAIRPDHALQGLVSYLKEASADWIRDNEVFPAFQGWQPGFGAFSCSWQSRGSLSNYIESQSEHHLYRTFQEEMEEMLTQSGVNFSSNCLV